MKRRKTTIVTICLLLFVLLLSGCTEEKTPASPTPTAAEASTAPSDAPKASAAPSDAPEASAAPSDAPKASAAPSDAPKASAAPTEKQKGTEKPTSGTEEKKTASTSKTSETTSVTTTTVSTVESESFNSSVSDTQSTAPSSSGTQSTAPSSSGTQSSESEIFLEEEIVAPAPVAPVHATPAVKDSATQPVVSVSDPQPYTEPVVATTAPTHRHVIVVDKAVEATCQHSGLTQGSHCSVCGEILEAQQVIEQRDHYLVDGVCKWCGKIIYVEPLVDIDAQPGRYILPDDDD